MQLVAALIGGIIGGSIAATIWVTIAWILHFEIAWIAWFVGILVGLGVRLGADKWEGVAPGGLALLLALAAVLGGKYVASEMIMPVPVNLNPTAVEVKKTMARTIIRDHMEKRVVLDWPKGNSGRQIQSQLEREIYPLSVLAEVDRRWNDMTEEQRNEMIRKEKERVEGLVDEFKSETRYQFIQNNFRIIDYLFFFLAAITAYRIGYGELTPQRR